MSLHVWPWTFLLDGFRERLVHETAVSRFGGGRPVRQKQWGTGLLRVDGGIHIDGDWSDWDEWIADHAGAAREFLYKAQRPGGAAQVESPEVDSPSQVDFVARRRYVDTATLVVKKNGVTQTITTHYSILDTAGGPYTLGDAGLMVRFVTPPGSGATVTLEYEFYYPVTFLGDDPGGGAAVERLEAGDVDACLLRVAGVTLVETGPGFNLRSPPVS